MNVRDIVMDADAFRRACPHWPYPEPDRQPLGQPLGDGTPVRYRKVGRGTVVAHTCPDEYPCWRNGNGPQVCHQYAVAFQTGRYRGTTRQVWVRNSEQAS